ncbi:GyrI-like small molecule binding domain-containing protein [Devosia crocina]|uniref:GyrI-like small molecule binding domain-containing protein n=1 Tax=Devosia crocina TaxID=429728 RepID=A0A1I7NDL7_9HYPH|nr:GyrI-like domain-containing protein [Devosia crocina]SFV32774.1 GyrI-like small molecule binding domain-containing protein [Devosia crocina]
MLTLPKIVEREARPYIYLPFTVRMDEMQRPANEGFPRLFGHIADHGLEPAGPAFYNYRRIDMADTLDVEAGIALQTPSPSPGEIRTGILPAGRYVTMTWHGHPDKLMDVTTLLVGWSRLTETHFDVEQRADGDHFACRLELYETDPHDVPDMNEWVTILEFKLKS